MIDESSILRKVEASPGECSEKGCARSVSPIYKQDEKVFTQHPRALAKNQIKFLRMNKLPSGSSRSLH